MIRSRIRGFTSFGVILRQTGARPPAAALHGVVLDNDVCDIRDPSRDACWTRRSTARRLRHERGRHLDRRRGGRGDREHGPARQVGRDRDRGLVDAHDGRRGTRSRHADRDLRRALDATVDVRAQPDRRRARRGSTSSGGTKAPAPGGTPSFNRIVRSKAGIFLDVGGDRNRSPATCSSAACGRRSSCRDRRATSCVTMSAAEPGGLARRFSEARYDDGRRAVSKFNQLDRNQNKASAAEGPPRAGRGRGRLGSPVLVEDRGERGLLRRGADPGSGARAHRTGHDRLHHGDRARGRAPGGAGVDRGDNRFRRPADRGARRAARQRSRVPVRERLVHGGPCVRRVDRPR